MIEFFPEIKQLKIHTHSGLNTANTTGISNKLQNNNHNNDKHQQHDKHQQQQQHHNLIHTNSGSNIAGTSSGGQHLHSHSHSSSSLSHYHHTGK